MSANTITTSAKFSAYNERRYSKPWGAIVTFDSANKPAYNFKAGSYLGDDMGGELVVTCLPGDIVAIGQRDNRNPKHTGNDWYVVDAAGRRTPIERADALRHYRAEQARRAAAKNDDNQPPQNRAVLEAERAALLERLAQINAMLGDAPAQPAKSVSRPPRRCAKGVMARAWTLARARAAQLGGKIKQYFADSLRAAWAEATVVAA